MAEKRRDVFLVAALAIVAFSLLAFVAALPGQSQSVSHAAPPAAQAQLPPQQQTASESSTRLTAETRPRGNTPPPAPVASSSTGALYVSAAQQNATLMGGLNWLFGGKQQRGWYLYTSLIQQTLGTDRDAATGDFAQALSRWQAGAGLAPTGVLDNDTWFKMFSTWQGDRIKNKAYPLPSQLLTAPVTDFWDTSRPSELRQVEREAYAAYKRMVAAAVADKSLGLAATPEGELAPDEKYLKIVSAFRSREYQEQLRRQSPNAGSAGLAKNSPHFTGRALDLYVGGEPVETKDSNRALQVQTPAYRWLVRNAERFGFRPYYYEPWHWEYVGN